MSREDPQMKLRMPAALKERVEAAARESGRSLNAEIVTRLQKSFSFDDGITANDPSVIMLLQKLTDAMMAASQLASDKEDAVLDVNFTIRKPDGSTIIYEPKKPR